MIFYLIRAIATVWVLVLGSSIIYSLNTDSLDEHGRIVAISDFITVILFLLLMLT